MTAFCQLADPSSYVAIDWDLTRDHDGREYWVGFFLEHIHMILKLGIEAAVARGEPFDKASARAAACHRRYGQTLSSYRAAPSGRVTTLTLDAWRDQILRQFGFMDCYIDLKNRENERMLPLLPGICRELDALDPADSLRAAIEGVFAGNIFDTGAKATAKAFLGAGPDFFRVRANVPRRPWTIDDFDALSERWLHRVYRKAVFFIDNAGSDFLLGALPLARWLARRGTRVVIAANELPTLNDMTIHDVREWWSRIVVAEPSLSQLPIERVSTGTGEPLLDLLRASDELNAAAADADLVILEGMGRGVMTNLDAAFRCDALNIAMLKDERVARRIGGKVFDVVCRFR